MTVGFYFVTTCKAEKVHTASGLGNFSQSSWIILKQ